LTQIEKEHKITSEELEIAEIAFNNFLNDTTQVNPTLYNEITRDEKRLHDVDISTLALFWVPFVGLSLAITGLALQDSYDQKVDRFNEMIEKHWINLELNYNNTLQKYSDLEEEVRILKEETNMIDQFDNGLSNQLKFWHKLEKSYINIVKKVHI